MITLRTTVLVVAAGLTMAWAGAANAAATPAQKCEAAKNKAAGKAAACLASQRAKEVNGKVPDYGSCFVKAFDAFTKAETKYTTACPTTGDINKIQSRLSSFDPTNGLGVEKELAGVRFIDNGDGTVTDTQSGRMWEKKVAGTSCLHCVNDTYQWSPVGTQPEGDAFLSFLYRMNNQCAGDETKVCAGDADCAVANGGPGGPCGFAGHRDWRLPEVGQDGGQAELESIVDPTQGICGGGSGPCINQTIFGPTQAGYYWSATTFSLDPTGAWFVLFGGGIVGTDGKTANVYVRAVRGGL